MSNYKINEVLLELKQYLQHTHQDNFEQLVLFGSRARGDYKPDSDIDVLIVLKNLVDYSQEIEKTSFFIAELCLENDVVISRAFTTSEQLS